MLLIYFFKSFDEFASSYLECILNLLPQLDVYSVLYKALQCYGDA